MGTSVNKALEIVGINYKPISMGVCWLSQTQRLPLACDWTVFPDRIPLDPSKGIWEAGYSSRTQHLAGDPRVSSLSIPQGAQIEMNTLSCYTLSNCSVPGSISYVISSHSALSKTPCDFFKIESCWQGNWNKSPTGTGTKWQRMDTNPSQTGYKAPSGLSITQCAFCLKVMNCQ